MNEPISVTTTPRRALGRGLEAIMGGGGDEPQSESVGTAQAAFQIAAILEGVQDRQVGNIFRFVQSIRQTAKGESVAELGEGLNRIDRERRERESNPRKGWWR